MQTTMKSIALAGAVLLSLGAPAAALAQGYGDHRDGDYRAQDDRGGWNRGDQRDGDGYRQSWRQQGDDYGRGYGFGRHNYGQRCFYQTRGYYNWHGQYRQHQVRVCR